MVRHGAPAGAWQHFADTLGLREHLLPVVANPNAVIAQRSKLRSLGKTPSVYDQHREVIGLGDWTNRVTTAADIARWSREEDYAIAIQARAVRAFDIDVPDPALAQQIENAIAGALQGLCLPARRRVNSGKRLLAFGLADPMPKRVVPVEGGVVEFLGDGQQFVAAGNHDTGVSYLWDGSSGLPGVLPELTSDELEAVWSTLCAIFATGEPRIARSRREDRAAFHFDSPVADEFAEWLADHWDVYDAGRNGELYLRCPFSDDHSTEGNETSTAYFPRGTGGYERGHWKCLHAHCMGRSDHDFTAATGYHGAGFAALATVDATLPLKPIAGTRVDALTGLGLPGEVEALPALVRNGKGEIEATADNLVKLLARPDVTMMELAWDDFRSEIMWQPHGEGIAWRAFGDADYIRLRIMLERKAVKGVGKELLRDAVGYVAQERQIDSAQTWLGALPAWDGRERVPTFLARLFGCADTPYNNAISRYLWTALAGRVLSPGCQVDMAPVFYGSQGQRKTSAIMAMVPSNDLYTDIDLSERDDNLSRRLRGKLIGELEELRGLKGRDSEAIKAWVSRRQEEWTPKFKEFGTKFKRRIVLIGSTNVKRFLADATGERRWLPTSTGVMGGINPEGIIEERDQLWAEAATRWRVDGVEWRDAERLARQEHGAFKDDDPWSPIVLAWLNDMNVAGQQETREELRAEGISSTRIAMKALNLPIGRIDHGMKIRVTRIMTDLGFEHRAIGTTREMRWFDPNA